MVVMQVVMLAVRRPRVAVLPDLRADATQVAMLAVQTPVVVQLLRLAVVNLLVARNVVDCCLACSLAKSLATAAVQNQLADATAVVPLLRLVDVLRLHLAVVIVVVQILVVVQLLHLADVNQHVDAAKVAAAC